jgi:TM2 domain-containing membrane protein YozV
MAKAKNKGQIEKRTDNLIADRITAMVLCAFLGIFGAHKFYTGQKRQGIAFIVLDLTIIGIIVSAIWAFINLFLMTIDKRNSKNELIVGILLLLFAGGSSQYVSREVVDRTEIIREDGGADKVPAKASEKK